MSSARERGGGEAEGREVKSYGRFLTSLQSDVQRRWSPAYQIDTGPRTVEVDAFPYLLQEAVYFSMNVSD